MNMSKAIKLVDLIVNDIKERSGLGNLWDEIDIETQNNIKKEWIYILTYEKRRDEDL